MRPLVLVRLITPSMTWEDYVHLAVDEIRLAGAGSPQVARRLSAVLQDLLTITPPERQDVLKEQLDLLQSGGPALKARSVKRATAPISSAAIQADSVDTSLRMRENGKPSTLCSLLVKYPHLRGTVLELPSVIENKELLWADKMDVGDRCTYMPGNMFREVPPADAYMVKRVIHDWNDTECLQILSTMHRAAPQQGRVLIIEQVVPGLDTPHFSKLFDIHMLIMSTGRERTLEEYVGLLEGAGWAYRQTWFPASKMLRVVEGVKA